ncbi:MAG: hypothetical protein DMF77_14715 [Acidobacteria bacterium]|nr:MAG: hypothetical protein DMF77_14715 [Acidobacteriota bacterium]
MPVGVVGALAGPALAALGALAALLSECTIEVEREPDAPSRPAPRRPTAEAEAKGPHPRTNSYGCKGPPTNSIVRPAARSG